MVRVNANTDWNNRRYSVLPVSMFVVFAPMQALSVPQSRGVTMPCAGPTHSTNWWLGACLSTLIPVIYSFTGGMRASVMTDMSQVRLQTSGGLLV